MKDTPKPWRVESSQYLFRKPWLTVRHDMVCLPSGYRIDEYFVFEYPPWVNVLACTDANEIVLVRQYRHGLGRVGLELPAGVVDPTDESLEAAARRELLEETGYGGGRWREFLVASANPSTTNNLTHTFLAEGVSREQAQRLEGSEDIEVVVLSEVDLKRAVEAGEVQQALHLAALYKWFLGA